MIVFVLCGVVFVRERCSIVFDIFFFVLTIFSFLFLCHFLSVLLVNVHPS